MLKWKLYKLKQQLKRFFKNLNFKPHYKKVNKYWVQDLVVKRVNNRLNYFIERCEQKDVIHFGCTDWPIFNPKNNLHIQLATHTKTIDGFDIDLEGIDNLRQYVDQDYYSEFSKVTKKKYDVCLVPETIEHVDNIKDFLIDVSKINAKKFIITGPNCFSKSRKKNYYHKKERFVELVHPDHNCWFSPYTLKNVIEKYTSLKVSNIYLLENDRMVCCEAVKVK